MHNPGAVIVSTIVTTGFLAVVVLWLVRPINITGEALTVLNILVGSLSAAFTTVVSYYLGSSAGSARKDERLAEVEKEKPAP